MKYILQSLLEKDTNENKTFRYREGFKLKDVKSIFLADKIPKGNNYKKAWESLIIPGDTSSPTGINKSILFVNN